MSSGVFFGLLFKLLEFELELMLKLVFPGTLNLKFGIELEIEFTLFTVFVYCETPFKTFEGKELGAFIKVPLFILYG